MIGIYTITNLIDGKFYVGYSKNIHKRINKHRCILKLNKHENQHLQNAYNLDGVENFKFELLVECEYKHLASEEHYWATLLNVHDNDFGYNISPTNPNNIQQFSKETRLKLSKASTGNKRALGVEKSELNILKRNVSSLKNENSNGSSKYKGVIFSKRDKCWKAQFTVNGKNIHLGYFKTEEDAKKIADEFRLKKLNELCEKLKLIEDQV